MFCHAYNKLTSNSKGAVGFVLRHLFCFNFKGREVDALPYFIKDKNVKLFTEHNILTDFRDVIFLGMQELRAIADEIESLVGEKYWPYPTYGQLLFSV
ncbi:MAG: hypothetical protein ACM3KR_04075 [Deltaproteobacteria bacterium]